jgi:hypothetical protein
MDLTISSITDEELERVETLIEKNIPKIEALVPEYIKIYNVLTGPPKADKIDKTLYREASLKAHPDKGGDAEEFKLLSTAYNKGNQHKFMGAYNKIMGNYNEALGELINSNGYKWALMYEEGKIKEVKEDFLNLFIRNTMKTLTILFLAISLTACSGLTSLDPKNLIKTAGTTVVTYAVAGPIPALANAATSIIIDEVLPDPEPEITQIEAGNREQMTAYIIANITDAILYGVLGFLAFIMVIGPWAAARRARRKMKDEYHRKKYDKMKAELDARKDIASL